MEPEPVSWLLPESGFPLIKPFPHATGCLPFIRTKSNQVYDAARLVGVRVVEVVEVVVVVVEFFFCRSLQASPCDGAEGVDGFLPGLEPAFCYRAHFLAPESDSLGLQGFFALLIPILKQVVTE